MTINKIEREACEIYKVLYSLGNDEEEILSTGKRQELRITCINATVKIMQAQIIAECIKEK